MKLATKPAILVSYYYLEPFLKDQKHYNYRDWSMDSGAFSAANSGVDIDLQAYIETCKRLMKEDKTLVEIFALDVIAGGKAERDAKVAARKSLKNCEAMWKAGVPAIPTYHFGEPESYLLHIAKNYPKIALGGMVPLKGQIKSDFARQCFARVWPKPIHGFGVASEKLIMEFPWHSVDATNWEMGPCAFGNWRSFGKMSVRGSNQNLRAEVEFYLKLERKAQQRWAKEMKKLKVKQPNKIYLAVEPGAAGGKRIARSISKKKPVRRIK